MKTIFERILLVEDSDPEIFLIFETLKALKCQAKMDILNYGKEVLPFLNSHLEQLPDLIILDLSLPDINGKKVLQNIKAQAHLHHIPIIIRTGFNSNREKVDCLKLGADWYYEKTDDIATLEYQVMEILHLLTKRQARRA